MRIVPRLRPAMPSPALWETSVPKELLTTDIRGQMILLGTGTSVGVPVIGCGCDVCRSDNQHNRRTRCSAILGLPGGNLLIDTSPDVRQQLLREQIGIVHAVLYTHEHADHVFGLDDLRIMQFHLGGPVPLYCEPAVEDRIRKSYDYAFASATGLHAGAVPQLVFRRIGLEPFEVLGTQVTPVRLKHGKRFDVLGFRIGNVAYCTDANAIPPETMEQLTGLDVLVLDALRPRGHATHFSLEEAIEAARVLSPHQTYFTHMSHELEHEATNAALPPSMALAYDGQRIKLT
jgi:phosphoribosyl 1,2-cyclic phosphate phosphodiesterase